MTVTPRDSHAQAEIRDRDWLTPSEYLDWCSYLTRDLPPSRDQIADDSHIPFEL